MVFLSLYVGFTSKVDSTNLEGNSGAWLGMLLVVVTSAIIVFGLIVVIIELLQVRANVRKNWASFVWIFQKCGCFSAAADTDSAAMSEVTEGGRARTSVAYGRGVV